jgi:hypothetical protein
MAPLPEVYPKINMPNTPAQDLKKDAYYAPPPVMLPRPHTHLVLA